MIVILEISPEFKYFSNVEILIFLEPANPLLFPKYEKIINTDITNP